MTLLRTMLVALVLAIAGCATVSVTNQWRDPKLIPGMDTWLEKEYWLQRYEPPKADGAPRSKWDGGWEPAKEAV